MGVGTESLRKCEFCEALKRKYEAARRLTRGTSVREEYSVRLCSVMRDSQNRTAGWESGRQWFRLNRCPVCGAEIKKRLRAWREKEGEQNERFDR